jgi:hypothetical protein
VYVTAIHNTPVGCSTRIHMHQTFNLSGQSQPERIRKMILFTSLVRINAQCITTDCSNSMPSMPSLSYFHIGPGEMHHRTHCQESKMKKKSIVNQENIMI